MFRNRRKRQTETTRSDHRPMLPELRSPTDPLNELIRSARRQDQLINPKEYVNWR